MDTNDQHRLIISKSYGGARTRCSLDQQTRLRIALYLAQRGCIWLIDSLRECGRAAGMNGAEMTANQQGTSHDARHRSA